MRLGPVRSDPGTCTGVLAGKHGCSVGEGTVATWMVGTGVTRGGTNWGRWGSSTDGDMAGADTAAGHISASGTGCCGNAATSIVGKQRVALQSWGEVGEG